MYKNIEVERSKTFVFNAINYNVLIINDNKNMNKTIETTLKDYGYNCFSVYDIDKSIQILEEKSIDYIVIDIDLIEEKNIDISTILKNRIDIKLFVLSTKTDEELKNIVHRYKKNIIESFIKNENIAYKIKQLPILIEKFEKNRYKTILVVDDSPVIQHHLKILLKSRNYNVEVADDTNGAWDIISKKPIDLMLLDLHLKNSYGLDFLIEKNTEIIERKKIPVLIISGDINTSIIKEGLGAGAVDIISKPYVPAEVMLKVDLWIDYRQKEDDILKSQQLLHQYKLAVDKSAIVSKSDPYGRITYVNEAFCEITGYTQDEVLGKSHGIVRHQDMDSKIFEDMWHEIKDLKQSWKGELKNKRKNGEAYWVSAVINPILNTKGEVIEYIAIRADITRQKESELKIKDLHEHTKDSIEYASLIQSAILPESRVLSKYFKDSFVIWSPKDTVGGDIWLFDELKNEDECLLMYIDCTGHGVPGAFVTMIVKAIEREIISHIIENKNFTVSPAWVLQYFNRTMKILLKQDTIDSISNAGFDGGVIYYNRKKQIIKFAGAETSLFYMDENNKLNTIKGDRYSVGYKRCDITYQYKEVCIDVKEGMKFYCTTDGYIDQNGGEKDFPFGKKRFKNIIENNHTKAMNIQKDIFLDELNKYESMVPNSDRNDDMTVIGIEIPSLSKKPEVIYEYNGILTQNIINHNVDILENNITDVNILSKLVTIVIELIQNMMKYSKTHELNSTDIRPAGHIEVLKTYDGIYIIKSKNILSKKDKDKISKKLIEITSLDIQGIKKRYKELRKSGENTHDNGGGIGFYEIAKISSKLSYEFVPINEDKYYFKFTVEVKPKGK